MNKPNLFISTGILAVVLATAVFSCSPDQIDPVNGTARLAIRLTDAPCDFDHLYVDVQGIEVHSESNGWQSLSPFNTGIYDILELTNGLDTLLCQVDLPAGTISQIRLILGDNNSLVENGQTFTMDVPSGSQSGLKVNLHQELLANTSYTVWLDFDACRSVVRKGNGGFGLKPVIRAFADSTNGKLRGWVLPDTVSSTVHVIDGSDTVSAIPNGEGYFLVCGLDGTYDVFVESGNPTFGDTLVQNVQVPFGSIVTMDTLLLH